MDEKQTADVEGKKSWERLEGEPAAAYHSFCLYRDFGPSRKIKKVLKLHELTEKKYGSWYRWSVQFDWLNRAAAFDEDCEKERRILAEEEKRRYFSEYKRALNKAYRSLWRSPQDAKQGKIDKYPYYECSALPQLADSGEAVRVVLVPAFTQRVVLTYVKARCAAADVLSVLQPLGVFRFLAVQGSDSADIAGMTAECEGKQAVIRFDTGETLLTEVQAVTGDSVTFNCQLGLNDKATVYVMADSSDDKKMSFAVGVEGTELRAEGGFACGEELGFPLVLEMENTDGKSVIEGGVAVFVGV